MNDSNDSVRDLKEYRESRSQPLHRPARLGRMHGEQLIRADVLPFALERFHKRRPRAVRDALSLPPLLGAGLGNSNVAGHLRDGVPAIENFGNAFHNKAECDGDGLSRQAGATLPATKSCARRTICRVGRAKTPVQFNKELALRLRSARVAAGYDAMPPFAKALGIESERYKKWESGRTPFQHEYLAGICKLTGKDANYFYGIQVAEQLSKRTGT